jgi:hypothetical protein
MSFSNTFSLTNNSTANVVGNYAITATGTLSKGSGNNGTTFNNYLPSGKLF